MPLSIEELLALPYGGATYAEPQTIDELLALNYTGESAFEKGLTGADFRREMRNHGERVRWLRSIERLFIEQSLDSAVRVFIYENRREVQGEDFGLIATGETRLSWMPDEISPLRDDRFIALDRVFEARQTIEPSGTAYETLDHKQIASISAVYLGGESVSSTNYALVNGQLMWISGYLPSGAVVAVCSYHPTYELLGDGWRQGPLGSDGVRLPSSAPLRLLTAGEE